MSNRLNIERTIFREYNEGSELRYGFLIYDDYGSAFSDCLTVQQMEMNPKDFLKLILDDYMTEEIGHIFEYIVDFKKGLYIDGDWYDYDQISDIIDKVYN